MSWEKYLPGHGFWTGHSSLYKDSAKVEYVKGQVSEIQSSVATARADAQAALKALNATLANTGFQVEASALDGVYDWLDTSLGTLNQQIDAKAQGADEYAKQSAEHPFLTGLATGGMILTSVGEGFVSAFEDVGDGVATITAGWGSMATDAIGLTHGANEKVSEFIERDLSHEAFHAVREATGINQFSAITEDSGLAGLAKTAGVAGGYLTMGGWLSGVGEGLTTVGNGGKLLQGSAKLLSSSTRANTIVAALGGYGSGMENELKTGKDFLGAQGGALKQAAIQGGTAYAMGKFGEKIQKNAAVKDAQAAVDKADDAVAQAQKAVDKADDAFKGAETSYKMAEADLENAGVSATDDLYQAYEAAGRDVEFAKTDLAAAKTGLDEAKTAATNAADDLAKVKGQKLSDFQGYNDPVSKQARESGKVFGERLGNNIGENAVTGEGLKGFLKNTANTTKAVAKTDYETAKEGLKDAFTKTAEDGTRKFAPTKLVTTPVKAVADVTVKQPLSLAKDAASGMSHSAPTVFVRDLTGAAAGTAVTYHNTNATQQHQARLTVEEKAGKIKDQTPITDTEGDDKGYRRPPKNNGDGKADDQFKDDDGDKKGDDKGDDKGQDPGPTPSGPSGPGGSTGGGDSGGGGGHYRKTDDTPTKTPDTKTPDTKTPDYKTPDTTNPDTTNPNTTNPDTTNPNTTNPDNTTPGTNTTPGNNTTPTPNAVVNNPGSSNNGGGTVHTGGGYTGDGNYTATNPAGTDPNSDGATGIDDIDGLLDGTDDSIDDIIKKGSNYTKIPSSSSAINSKSSGGSAVIPIAAGLTAAAAAGIGAKAYLDRKNNNDVGEDDFYGDEWDGDENLEIDYGDSGEEQYLDDDDYGYQATENTESYSARTNDELADIQ